MEEAAQYLVTSPQWQWLEGMVGLDGSRLSAAGWSGAPPQHPDLTDAATAGTLIGILDETGALRDVVRDDDQWIVAVEIDGELRGYAADLMGEAAAWALLAVWGTLDIAV